MDPTRRAAYLQALEIEAWERRGARAQPVASGPAPVALSAPASASVSAASAPPAHAARKAPPPAARPTGPAPGIAERTSPEYAPAAPFERPAPATVGPPIIGPPIVAPPIVAPASAPARVVSPPTPVPSDWEGLRAAVKDCRACRLCETRTQTVFGVGPQRATLMVVGEAPGADEDAQGEPFVGRAGKLLDPMLAAIGRSRERDTYIANAVKCRPPNNREPEPDEVEACRGFLEMQLQLVQPKLIVALGRVAAQRLLGTTETLGSLRGKSHTWGAAQTPLRITYHPAYLLRSPREKAKAWEDLKKVRSFLDQAR